MLISRRRWSFPLGILLSVVAGCSDTTGASGATRAAAGVYIFQPSGQQYEPESGRIVLLPMGKAERRVSYLAEGQPDYELVSTGTFRVEGSTVHLELVQQDTDFPYTWRTDATLDGPTLTLGYPGPADGWITETYRR